MIWFQRDCDEETRRLSSQVTRYAFTSDNRRSASPMSFSVLCTNAYNRLKEYNFRNRVVKKCKSRKVEESKGLKVQELRSLLS